MPPGSSGRDATLTPIHEAEASVPLASASTAPEHAPARPHGASAPAQPHAGGPPRETSACGAPATLELTAALVHAQRLGVLGAPLDAIVGECSGRCVGAIDAIEGLGTALSIDRQPSEVQCLHFTGDVRDVLFSRRWRRVHGLGRCVSCSAAAAPEGSDDEGRR